MNRLQTFAAKLLGVATEARHTLPPRGEPPNITASVKVSDVQSAIRQAEQGETEALFRLYRDSLLGDDHVQSCLNTRKLAMLAQPLAIMPADETNPDDVAAVLAVKRAVKDCENWTDGLSALLDATLWPVAITEKLFRAADAPQGDEPRLQYTLRRFEPVNPMLLCYRWAYEGLRRPNSVQGDRLVDFAQWEPFLKLWPVDEYGNIRKDTSKAEPLDPTRHLVHRGHLLSTRDNWGGPMRAILFWWLLRGLGRDWFARFMERYGMPFPKGKTNTQDPAAVAFLQEAFSLSTKIGGIVIGQDDEVDLVQAIVQGGAEGHKTWHQVCNNAISRAITGYGENDAPAGLNAGASNKSENVREDVRMFDQMRLSETLKRQLITQFLRINGLTGNVELVWGGLSDVDASSFSTVLVNLSTAGLEPTDESLPVVNKRLGFTVQRKAVAPSPFGGGFGDPTPAAPRSAPPAPRSEEDDDEEEIETLASRDLHGRLVSFSAGPRADDPPAKLARARREQLGKAYRGAMAPFRAAILESNSRAEAMAKLQTLYADWSPERLNAELDEALQLCAVAGAVQGKG